MKQERIIHAMADLPEELLGEADEVRQSRSKAPRLRRRVRWAVAAAAVILLTVTGAAAYHRWQMPRNVDGISGEIYQNREENTYPARSDPQQPSEALQPYTDLWFVEQAKELMGLVGWQEAEDADILVTRRRNNLWSREEVVVSWVREETREPTVTFDAESGYLIGISAFRPVEDGGVPMEEAEALAIVRKFYDALPYAKGYEYHDLDQFDDHAWMFSFDRVVEVTIGAEVHRLHSDYEQVRVTIDPCTGEFVLSNCFYVPLLDDHGGDDQPITMEQAVAAALSQGHLPLGEDAYDIQGEIGICLPRPEQFAQSGADAVQPERVYPYCDVTRLGWILTFTEKEHDQSPFLSRVRVCVDLYTGQLLSEDVSK